MDDGGPLLTRAWRRECLNVLDFARKIEFSLWPMELLGRFPRNQAGIAPSIFPCKGPARKRSVLDRERAETPEGIARNRPPPLRGNLEESSASPSCAFPSRRSHDRGFHATSSFARRAYRNASGGPGKSRPTAAETALVSLAEWGGFADRGSPMGGAVQPLQFVVSVGGRIGASPIGGQTDRGECASYCSSLG